MNQIIVRPSYIRRRALAAFHRRAGRDSHGMHPWTAAARTFQLRYDRLAAVARHAQPHHAPTPRSRVEHAQGGSVSIIHLVSISSGKDSQATAEIAIERFGKDRCVFVFADTGNEDQAVFDHLAYLESVLGITIHRLRAEFTQQIADKRQFVARDVRIGRKYKRVPLKDSAGKILWQRDRLGNIELEMVWKRGKMDLVGIPRTRKVDCGRKRWSNKAKRRALAVLHPTGNPYLDLCIWKGRFPSRTAQFCTTELKTLPLTAFALDLIEQGNTVVSWQGVRRDESHNRKDALKFEVVGGGLYIYRPIVEFTAQQTVDHSISRGIKINPLYSEDFDRVGCMLCMNAGKDEISNCADRKPHHIARLASWEPIVKAASKRGGATFFPNADSDPIDKPDIWAVVKWAKTSRGGRQTVLFEPERNACSSSYGLCE